MRIKLFERFDEERKTVDELGISCGVERLLLGGSCFLHILRLD